MDCSLVAVNPTSPVVSEPASPSGLLIAAKDPRPGDGMMQSKSGSLALLRLDSESPRDPPEDSMTSNLRPDSVTPVPSDTEHVTSVAGRTGADGLLPSSQQQRPRSSTPGKFSCSVCRLNFKQERDFNRHDCFLVAQGVAGRGDMEHQEEEEGGQKEPEFKKIQHASIFQCPFKKCTKYKVK